MVRLRVRAQTIFVGQFHIQSYENSGIGLQKPIMVLVVGESPVMMPNLPTCLSQNGKTNFRCPNFQSKKSQRFVLSAIRFPRFQNRSVFGTLSLPGAGGHGTEARPQGTVGNSAGMLHNASS